MLEIEQKYRWSDFTALEERLASWQAVPGEDFLEADHYFNAPDRDFVQTGEVFRMRRVGVDNFLTYKGPKRAAAVKVRKELELAISSGDQAAEQVLELLVCLGFRPVAVVRKRRRTFTLKREGFPFTVCLDEVDEVGRFVEVEILAPEESMDQAGAALSETARALGLEDVEPRSYLTMLLANREKKA